MLAYSPESVRIDLTGRCNLRCTHCQASMFLGKRNLELSTTEWKKILDQLAEAGAVTVGFLGGEPFLRKDLLEVMAHAKKLGLKTTVTTNGTMISQGIAESLILELDTYTVFSLDGPSSESHDQVRGAGTFDKTISTIKKFAHIQEGANKKLLGISAVLHAGNYSCFTDVFDTAYSLGANSLSLAVVHNTGRATSNWDRLAISSSDLIKISTAVGAKAGSMRDKIKLRLDMFPAAYREYLTKVIGVETAHEMLFDMSGVRECYIQHDGRVFPSQQCSEMIPNVLSGAYKLGIRFEDNSLKTKKFEQIWRGREFQLYRNHLLTRSYINKMLPCDTCKFQHTYCQPSFGHYLKGEVVSHPLCRYVEESYPQLLGSL